MDGWIDFAAIAAAAGSVCLRPDRARGARPPYPTEIMVRLLFIQSLYNLSGEDGK